MHEKTEQILLYALFGSLGLLFGSLYWFYSHTPAFVDQAEIPTVLPTENRQETPAENSPDASQGTQKTERQRPWRLFGRSTQLTLLGDTFSGQSLLRDPKFQRALASAELDFAYENELDQVVRLKRLGKDADMVVTTLDQYLRQQPQGKIVGLVSQSTGADALVLNTRDYPELTDLAQLQTLIETTHRDSYQLEFAFASDSPSEYLALALEVRHPGLSLSQLRPQRYADASEIWQALQTTEPGPVAMMLRDPYVTRAVEQGYTIAASSDSLPDPIISVIVASDRVLKSAPETVSVFLEVYYRHIDNDVRDAAELQAVVARDGSVAPQTGAVVLDHIDFFTALEAQHWLSEGRLLAQARKVSAILAVTGQIDRTPRNLQQLLDLQPIEQAAHNTSVLVELVEADNPDLADEFKGLGNTVQTR
ncbi:MAG: hypothetical protein AAFU71_05515 [Cyanobacteria bacterium J06632_22]